MLWLFDILLILMISMLFEDFNMFDFVIHKQVLWSGGIYIF